MRKFLAALLICSILSVVGVVGFSSPAVSARVTPRQPLPSEREVRELEAALKAMEQSIDERQARVIAADRELAQIRAQIVTTRRTIQRSETELSTLTTALGRRVRHVYRHGSTSYISLLLMSEGIADLVIRLAYVARLFNHDARLMQSVRDQHARLLESAARLRADEERVVSLAQQRAAEQRNLQSERQELERLLRQARTRLAGELALVTPRAERMPLYAVVIDNIEQARPQWGLAESIMVYEYEVEGRITRYLALLGTTPQRVGPVRSARAHSAMLALENRAHFVYSGGGADVLDLLRGWNVTGTDASRSRTTSFWRDNTRRAPHNLFINLATLGTATPRDEVVIRPAYLPFRGEEVARLDLEYSPTHKVSYVYVQAQAAFRRYIDGNVHRDANGTVIMARNIFVVFAPHRNDLLGRPTPQLIGEGRMHYYALGQKFEGTWSKSGPGDPMTFYYADGTPVERVFGQTWVQIMRGE